MLITKECDYALRVIRSLSDGEKQKVEVICGNEDVPTAFAYRILKQLEKSGFVRSFRGADGGYQLVVDLNRLTLLNVINSIRSNIFVNDCVNPNYQCPRHTAEHPCAFRAVFGKLQENINRTLSESSVAEILSIHPQLEIVQDDTQNIVAL